MAPRSSADAIVVAAGRSTRMDGIDKISAPIGGRPLLAWALRPFEELPAIERIVVVAAQDRVEELRSAAWLGEAITVVAGGQRRQEAVAAGTAELARGGRLADRIVLVHDGARPAVGTDLIAAVIDAAAEHGAAIPV